MSEKKKKLKENENVTDQDETEYLEAQNPTKDDLDSVIRKAAHALKADQTSSPSPEFLKRVVDVRFIKQLANDYPFERNSGDAVSTQFPVEIDEYEAIQEVGRGGMGRVFMSRHKLLGKIQAVKFLHNVRIDNPESMARFMNEMRVVGKLDHSNIVSAQHAGNANGMPYLVMEFVQGHTLSELENHYSTKQKQFPIPLACEVIRQAAIGIHYIHSRGVIHRDIKPGNIMLDQNGVVRILDLGLARFGPQNSEDSDSPAYPTLTQENQILGTPNFMAPEQIKSSRDVDARADIYGLGATLFKLLTGQVVYPAEDGANFFERATQITTSPVPDAGQLRSDIPKGLVSLVTRCLQKQPEDRLATAEQLAQSLEIWSEPVEESSVKDPSGETRRDDSSESNDGLVSRKTNAKRSRLNWVWIGLTASLLLITALTIIIRLKMPQGGELVVECDNPNAKITIIAKQEGESRRLNVDGDGTMRLHDGMWEIEIAGINAAQYHLSKHTIVISNGETEQVRIYRTSKEAGIVTHESTGEFAVDDNALYERIPGYVDFPVGEKLDLEWQVIPNFVSNRGVEMIGVSPKGTYLVACNDRVNDPYTRILNRKTGRMVGLFFNKRRYERFIAWSPDESMLAVHWFDWNQSTTTICRPDGTILYQWSADPDHWPQVPSWNPDGKSILFVGKTTTLRTFQGDSVRDFTPPQYQADAFSVYSNRLEANPFWSPDGSKFGISFDGKLTIYSKEGKPISVFAEKGPSIESFLWHPDGERFLTKGTPKEGENVAYRIWTQKGKYTRFGFSRLHERVVGFTFDGESLITNYGCLRDLQGNIRANFKYDNVRVKKSEMINVNTMVARSLASGNIVVLNRTRGIGLTTEFDSEGKQLSQTSIPAPNAATQMPWQQTNAMTIAGIPARVTFDDGAQFSLNFDGEFEVNMLQSGLRPKNSPLESQALEEFDSYFTYVVRQKNGQVMPMLQREFLESK